MQLTDYHIHSICSPDGHYSMLDMALAAKSRGITQLCFTDHCDMDDDATGNLNPNCFNNRERLLEMYSKTLREKPDDLKILLGMELGGGNHDSARASEIAATPELDFVLGSLHNLKGKPDFYYYDYRSMDECRALNEAYLDELIELSKLPFFDVMAHVGYTIRYMRKKGFNISVDVKDYPDRLKTLFKNLIERGKGIEINCSGFGNTLVNGPIPTPDALRLYRELGGEIITVGSDAHIVKHAGSGIREGYALLSDLGYRYVTVFEKRKPAFIKI